MSIRFAIILFFLSIGMSAQQAEGLSIALERDGTQEITYPPETEFYLFNEAGDAVLADGDLTGNYPIRDTQFLIVKPPYKDGYDRFTLRPGDVLGLPGNRAEDSEKRESISHSGKHDTPVTVEKEFLGTSANGERNVLLVFSNGLVFRYFNGVARAWVDGEEVPIYGKYSIEMDRETVKFSYDPDTGTVWYTVNSHE